MSSAPQPPPELLLCRTCREPMRGHPRPTCAEIQRLEELGVISRAPSTLSELESISSATKVEVPPGLPPLSAKQARFTKSARSTRSKNVRFSLLRPSATPVARSGTYQLQASYQAPPTIEELTAFLLGVDHPVDPPPNFVLRYLPWESLKKIICTG
ncbi:hypothetical protein BKA70DRAFT_1438563 [Coprinopsis sp. MPI-PUGE-AT-0042]|nr:hypothetical protein BKA70DRAFT_1438563 [Coprinopsis sp. MPI-PUGE-AT-0042]